MLLVKKGFGPDCARPTCVNDKCAIINPCSLRKQCTVRNTTQCFASFVCARCLPGYSPPCTEVYCVNGNCKVVGPCSIFTSTTKVTIVNPNCKSNVECPVPVDCRKKCPQGYGPLCASAKCSDGKCVAIGPCSIAEECLPTNLSSCPIPKICALCKTGYEPPCATASCIDGKCHIVQPCSIFKPPKQSCEKDTDCKFSNTCVERCDDKYSLPCTTATCNKTECVIHPPCSIKRYCTEDDVSQCRIPIKCSHCLLGYSPSCTRITCVNRQCKAIEPCSILTTTVKSTLVSTKILVCRNDSDCKANEMNCTECMKGFGPSCEYATCQNNLCIQIKPCSKKLDRS